MANYEDAVVEMSEIDPEAVDGFKSYNPHCFYRVFRSKTSKVDVILNNMAVTFNGYIVTAKTKHVMSMLEKIRTAC